MIYTTLYTYGQFGYRASKARPGFEITNSETLKEKNWWDRGSFITVKDPVYGEITLQGPLWKMSETPPRLKWICRPVGADNEFIYLKYIGYGKNKLAEMKRDAVI